MAERRKFGKDEGDQEARPFPYKRSRESDDIDPINPQPSVVVSFFILFSVSYSTIIKQFDWNSHSHSCIFLSDMTHDDGSILFSYWTWTS